MYQVDLTEAYFPAQPDADYRERTVEETLRSQAAERPDAMALREALADGTIGREWTYAQLLADACRFVETRLVALVAPLVELPPDFR